MDYRSIKVPFLGNSLIKRKADLFRVKHWNNSIPVEIEDILDIKLEIDIIPIKDLQKFCDTDALVTSNWNSVYVDYEKYLDERYKNRLRFSFAHEIGHFILHKNIYDSFKIKELSDFYRLIEEIPGEQYGYLETQANKFANYLLVPRDKLILEKQKVIKKYNLSKIEEKTLNSYIAIPLSKVFGVSEEVIEIALTY